MIVNEVTIIL